MTMHHYRSIPHSQGLYNPDYEHDACGVGFRVSHDRHSSEWVVNPVVALLVQD